MAHQPRCNICHQIIDSEGMADIYAKQTYKVSRTGDVHRGWQDVAEFYCSDCMERDGKHL